MKNVILFIALCGTFLAAQAADTTYVNLQVGASAKTSPLAVVDSTTGDVITANISNVVIDNSHPEIISITSQYYQGGAYTIKATPVSGGSGIAKVTCHVVYTDPGDGLQKSEDKVIVIAYAVTYTPPHGAKLSLTFN